jgi:hypothetical protein
MVLVGDFDDETCAEDVVGPSESSRMLVPIVGQSLQSASLPSKQKIKNFPFRPFCLFFNLKTSRNRLSCLPHAG